MDRRKFLGSSVAALVVTALPAEATQIQDYIFPQFPGDRPTAVKWFPDTEELMRRIVTSFPEQYPGEGNVMGFLITNRNKNGFTIENKVANASEEYNLEDIFVDDLKDQDYFDYDRSNMITPEALEVSSIVRAGNKIALITRRGRGNHYAVFHDHILVWYAQNSNFESRKYDTPVARVGKNVIINSNFKDYFFKVKGIKLTDEHHEMLEKLGYKRII